MKLEVLSQAFLAQWWRIHLPGQETRVPPLGLEDPIRRGATKPVGHEH